MTSIEATKYFTNRTVLQIKPAGNGYIILALYGREFATWYWNGKSDSGDDGHYFGQNLRAALDDFEARE